MVGAFLLGNFIYSEKNSSPSGLNWACTYLLHKTSLGKGIMARSLCNAKLLASSIADGPSLSIFRRGYTAAAPREWVSRGFNKGGPSLMGKVADGSSVIKDKEDSTSWSPDPITGYYRPANRDTEIDPVELRELLLNHRVKSH